MGSRSVGKAHKDQGVVRIEFGTFAKVYCISTPFLDRLAGSGNSFILILLVAMKVQLVTFMMTQFLNNIMRSMGRFGGG